MKRTLLFFFSFLCCAFAAQAAPKLYITANPINQGDVNQAEGVKEAIEKLSPQKLSSQFLDARQPDAVAKQVMEDLAKDQKVILIGAGEGGVLVAKDLKPHPNLIICLTSHQLLAGYEDPTLLAKVSFIALPTHVSAKDKELIGSKLIETVGVSHNRQVAKVEATYKKWKKVLPPCSNYVGVILGGDAPLPPPAKGMKWFTEEDVIRLANFVTQHAKGNKACVLVLNGPRTGKYDKNQQEVLTVHRNGESDPLSKLFLQKLKEAGVKTTFFDFQHKSPDNKKSELPFNAFELVVGAIKAHKGTLLVPGESTSMISEAVDLLFPTPRKVPIVYLNNAMNEVHKAHVASEHAGARVVLLEDYVKLRNPRPESGVAKPSAAKTIAQAILDAAKKQWE
jgi:hypothetical protein